MSAPSRPSITRRDALALALVGLLDACRGVERAPSPVLALPEQIPSSAANEGVMPQDAVDALFDVLLPAEFDDSGRLVSAGAREAGVDELLERERFVRLAIEQGFIKPFDPRLIDSLDELASSGRLVLNTALDARAQLERPGRRFADLERATQERIVEAALADDATRPAMLVLRAACFTAYLGAVTSDVGLRELGFPPFASIDAGVAGLGWPRMVDGRLDDYSHNRLPQPTSGDDLSLVLTADGDLA